MTEERRTERRRTGDRFGASAAAADQHLTTRDLARRWQVSVKKLENDRWRGGGVPFVRIGSAVRYRLSDILAFEESSLFCSTSAPKSPGAST